jgi:hypothetical protein
MLTRRQLMRSFAKVLGLLVVAGSLSGCWGSSYEWNQKLTLVVQTPQGEVTGASVIHANFTYGQMPMSGNDMSGGYTGEAAVVKVAEGKYLFALLDTPNTTDEYHRVLRTFRDKVPGNREAGFKAIQKLRGARPAVPAPLLVSFKDITDPTSVFEVKSDDFTSAFGAGYALKSITLEITDEPVTEGAVEKVIPWVVSLKGSIGKDTDLPYDHILNKVHSGKFRQGVR